MRYLKEEELSWSKLGLARTAENLGIYNLDKIIITPLMSDTAVSLRDITIGFEFEIVLKESLDRQKRGDAKLEYDACAIAVAKEMRKRHPEMPEIKIFRNKSDKQTSKEWGIKPDGSLNPAPGAELISPAIISHAVAEETLKDVIDVIKKSGGKLYTNDSTGLHMTYGNFPGTSRGKKLNRVKLLIAVNERRLISTFGREKNKYTRPVDFSGPESDGGWVKKEERKNFQSHFKSNPEHPAVIAIVNVIESEINKRITKDITSQNKYRVVNLNKLESSGLIEFRGAGNDYHNRKDDCVDALRRYSWAISVAADPKEWRKDYIEKLVNIATVNRN